MFSNSTRRRRYNNTASLHVYNAFHRNDRNNHSDFHIDVYKHVHINIYKHVHIDVYKHDHKIHIRFSLNSSLPNR
ncbi:hypothetical protein WR25_12201 [Diploscapter pachys]|uniref:Uncharacterized protein n=1 Tax=Diploscapter pachys TaxID=2018661 RepID=A0A2A2LWK5_9BILA|nr:hypothetical protein WR25_12201 [Diploscapter pachys]